MGLHAVDAETSDGIPPPRKRAVGYVRVSRGCQAQEGESLETQEAEIEAYCEGKGWDLIETYRDIGMSAWSAGARRRPGYEKMMTDINHWDIVVCYKLDRLWRQVDVAIGAHEIFKAQGKEIVSVTENFDTSTPSGEAMFSMICVMAELFSSQTRERILAIQRHIFETDRDGVLGSPPTGYAVVRRKGRPNYVIEPRNTEVVRRIFALALEGTSVIRIVARMRAEGITYLRWNKPPPRTVNHGMVFNVLHNPFYCGYIYKEGILRRARHPRLVSDDDFNRVQVMMLVRGNRPDLNPLIVGADRIEVRKTVDPRKAHKGETSGGPTKYLPLRPAERLEAFINEQGPLPLERIKRVLSLRAE